MAQGVPWGSDGSFRGERKRKKKVAGKFKRKIRERPPPIAREGGGQPGGGSVWGKTREERERHPGSRADEYPTTFREKKSGRLTANFRQSRRSSSGWERGEINKSQPRRWPRNLVKERLFLP